MTGKGKEKVFGVICEDGVLRHPEYTKRVLQVEDNIATLAICMKNAVEKYPDNKCMGWRPLISSETVTDANTGRKILKCKYDEYKWLSYKECFTRINNLAKGLLEGGVQPGDNVVIFMDTCIEWQLAAHACHQINAVVVTIYSTLGEEAVVYGINQTKASHVFTQESLVKMLQGFLSQCPDMKKIIYFGEDKNLGENTITYKAIEEAGQKSSKTIVGPKPDDIAVIMYTSGSTGLPKGVLVTHRQIIAGANGVSNSFYKGFFTPNDRYIGYLPLAHILELLAETTMFFNGASIGYGSPLTLSDASPKIAAGTRGDAPTLKPTLMASVPAIMDKIRKAVNDRVSGGSALVQWMFSYAFSAKEAAYKTGTTTPIWDMLVFNKIKNMLGGELRVMLSGGAPLSADTQKFMNVCFGIPVAQGYGLTETCGATTICNPTDKSYGRVGGPIASMEIKLKDWDEGGYRWSDKDNKAIGLPRGEILISGANLSSGYYLNPEKTKEEYVTDASGKVWFHTGDVGQIHPNGTVQIIDRKKDLVKLQMGEYVSLGKVEASLKGSEYVDNIMVYADSMQSYTIAIVQPSGPKLEALSVTKGIEVTDWKSLCENSEIVDAVLKSIQAVGQKDKLARFEIPTKLYITSEEWTPESNLVTAALKLKRNELNTHYKAQIKTMYL